MTDATSEQTPADEDKCRIIENAIMAFRPDDFPPETRSKPESCLVALAKAPTVRRLTKHRRLIDGLRRSAADDRVDRDSLDDAARVVLGSTLEPDLPDNTRQRLIERAKSRLDEVVA